MVFTARLGDFSTGHGTFFPRPNIGGSPDTFTNGRPNHRQFDPWSIHCDFTPTCHFSILAAGSPTVYTNGRQQGRVGDPVLCGDLILTGSFNSLTGN